MMQLFLFGTFWFWAIIIAVVVIVIYLIEVVYELELSEEPHGGWAAFVIIITLALLVIFGNWESFQKVLMFIRDHPLISLGYLASYIFVGIVWSFFKWYDHLKKMRNILREAKKIYAAKVVEIPKFNDHVDFIVTWAMYWPFSILWALTKDCFKLFRNWFSFLVERLRFAYESIIKSMFKEFEEEEK